MRKKVNNTGAARREIIKLPESSKRETAKGRKRKKKGCEVRGDLVKRDYKPTPQPKRGPR